LVRWSRTICFLFAIAATAACSSSANESRAFLSRYAAEWQLTPGPALAGVSPRGTATPGSSRAGGAGSSARSSAGAGAVLVYLDPGHGGVDRGTSGTDIYGREIDEKTITLEVARQTAKRLQNDGIGVALSRSDDSTPEAVASDFTGDGTMFTPEGVLHDLQHRVDRANASGAQVLLSIHFNAFSDPSIGGSETFFDVARPFADQNERFARLIQDSVMSNLQSRGILVLDRGVTDDASLDAEDLGTLGGAYRHLILLGPPLDGKLRASQMPGALSEPLFLSNPAEATAAGRPEVLAALADGYADAIEEFLRD
jgi:N-acetylmuramoyl-L-alanine amidase